MLLVCCSGYMWAIYFSPLWLRASILVFMARATGQLSSAAFKVDGVLVGIFLINVDLPSISLDEKKRWVLRWSMHTYMPLAISEHFVNGESLICLALLYVFISAKSKGFDKSWDICLLDNKRKKYYHEAYILLVKYKFK